jgi:hypothetical protein
MAILYLGESNYRYAKVNLRDGKWHHIAFVVSGPNQSDILSSKIWADGVIPPIGNNPATSTPSAPSGNVWIGANAFIGAMDQVIIHARALSPGEILRLYQDPYCGIADDSAGRYYSLPGLRPVRRIIDGSPFGGHYD